MDHATQPVLSMQTIAPASLAEFARLIPADRAAMIAFDHVASKMKADPAWNRHARKYMSIYPEKTVFEFVGSDSESESGLGPQAQRRLIWRGFYRFDLDTPPQDPRCGWLLGGGKFASSDESPELVLTERKAHDLMFGRHARLFHNYSSGALVLGLGDRSFAVVDGKVVRDSIAIWSINTRITLGTLTYKLQLDGAPEAVHRARLIRYQHTHGLEAEDLPVSLLSTPAESDFIHKDYVIKNAVGHGGSSTVFAGEHIKTGAVVAIKRITRNHSNAGQIQQEIEMATILGRHPRLCQLVDKMSPKGDRRSVSFRSNAIDEVYLIYTPLAAATWLSLCGPGPTSDTYEYNMICTDLFWQCLEGVEYIHSKGVMHTDIKPCNLAIVSFNPPRGRVIDFASARRATSSNCVKSGTPSYWSPEMWRLWRSGQASGLEYDGKADIFAFGVCAYQIFCKQPKWWGQEVQQNTLLEMKEDVGSKQGAPLNVKNLIKSMLAEDALLRPSAEDARKSGTDQEVEDRSMPSA